MKLYLTCACGKRYPVSPETFGRRAQCVACGRVHVIPAVLPGADGTRVPVTDEACGRAPGGTRTTAKRPPDTTLTPAPPSAPARNDAGNVGDDLARRRSQTLFLVSLLPAVLILTSLGVFFLLATREPDERQTAAEPVPEALPAEPPSRQLVPEEPQRKAEAKVAERPVVPDAPRREPQPRALEHRVGEVLRLEGQGDRVVSVAFSPDGRLAVSTGHGGDPTVRVWDLSRRRERAVLAGHRARVSGAAFLPDGVHVVSVGAGTMISGQTATILPDENGLRLWNLDSGREVARWQCHQWDIEGLAVTPDGKRALTSSWDKSVRVWDLQSKGEIASFGGHTASVFSVAVSPDGDRALSGDLAGRICVWYLRSGRLLHQLDGHASCVTSLMFSPDGRQAVSGSTDKSVRLWDVEAGRELRRFVGHSAWVNSVCFSPDGRRVLSGSGGEFVENRVVELDDNSVCLWDCDTAKLVRRFSGHGLRVSCVRCSPDGRYALSGSWDKTVRLWGLP